jgi:ribonuclease BN (tRNA processing enzyme)
MNIPNTKIALLGTGNPNPDPQHNGPSLAILVNETPYLIDCGPGIIRQCAALTPRYGGSLPALNPENLKIGFLTHLHSDHTIGLPDLILTSWVMGRKEPLKIFGPVGTQELCSHILEAYKADIDYRLNGLEPASHSGWQVIVDEFHEGMIFRDENIMVEAFEVSHGTLPNSFGFRFTTEDKTIVISGDTAPCESIRKYGQGADILIHEVYYHHAFSRQQQIWQEYHRIHHTSTLQLARLSNEIQPGLLVLYHTLFWGGSKKDILQEIKDSYGGEVILGEDLQVIE